jgi:TPP-dependent 2-oxoacid decarboxylase
MKIGDFLFRRLEEAGVLQLFGVPGDAGVHGSIR